MSQDSWEDSVWAQDEPSPPESAGADGDHQGDKVQDQAEGGLANRDAAACELDPAFALDFKKSFPNAGATAQMCLHFVALSDRIKRHGR